MVLPTLPEPMVAPSGRHHRLGPERGQALALEGRAAWPRLRRLLGLRALPALVFLYLGVTQLSSIRSGLSRAAGSGRLWSALPALVGESLYVLFVLLTVALVLRRPPARARDSSAVAWCLAMAATFGMLLVPRLPPGPVLFDLGPSAQLVWVGILVSSLSFSTVTLSTLGRSFSLTPEARGLVTTGPYRLVRHPLYLSESATLAAYVLASGRLTLLLVVVAILAIQVLRSRLEERILSEAFPEYHHRFQGVAHLVPGIY